MNWTVFGFDLAISLSIAWFIARPINMVQRVAFYALVFIASLGAAIASEGMESWRSIMICALPLAAIATYTSIVLFQMQRLGKRWNDAPAIDLWWRQDVRDNDGWQDSFNGRPQTGQEDVRESSG